MKYQSEFGFTYPVLSPESDHYPGGSISTEFREPAWINDELRFNLTFIIQEPTLEKLIIDHKARCTAMLYCRATLYQQTFTAPEGSLEINARINAQWLRDAVELHPLIVAAETIALDTTNAHPFYQGTAPTITEGDPIAADLGWHFSVNVASLPVGSIFQFIPVEKSEKTMEIEVEPNNPYINIRVNDQELQKMEVTRQQGLSVPSVLSAALVTAIHAIRNPETDEEPPSPGWVDTIKKQSEKLSIDLNYEDPFVTAQKLLGNPFTDLREFLRRNSEDDEE